MFEHDVARKRALPSKHATPFSRMGWAANYGCWQKNRTTPRPINRRWAAINRPLRSGRS